ncbi:Lytic transglycosylase, catalytic [Candidatus Ruthia magnifica str. Cm (Calyptogena magnifica)]|uniref:Lytic transglycosylase, catalytic n=1 Tax=Ruthia magnifica subsp. Calyptogena magnifica TaxID=413404 RepID=A1AWW3_RUTMC|nr:transglycosylase SLT domain-containing protein [Candidatus Ruthturnera calyptogenae]ABL02420.1 Lytic transglycosylase, catalytic [Candidatus Ruthia magnifica str. Cm (Calyptogena magnifica)]
MIKKYLLIVLISLTLNGCFSTPAIQVNNICHLMDEQVSWYQAVKASERRYGSPIHVQLAIMYQESHFASDAKPPRNKLFGVLPWFRVSSAYGFAQVKDTTWEWYQLKTNNKNANRDNFDDAIDFIGWYIDQSSERSNIDKSDTYNQYLAYHEGHAGFNKQTYSAKPWLLKIARSVDDNAQRYKHQLKQCALQLDGNNVWRLF